MSINCLKCSNVKFYVMVHTCIKPQYFFFKQCLAIEPRLAFNSCSSSLYTQEIRGWSTAQGTAQHCWLTWGSKLRSRRYLLFNLTWNCSKFSFLQLVHGSISGKCPQGKCRISRWVHTLGVLPFSSSVTLPILCTFNSLMVLGSFECVTLWQLY